MSETDHVTIKPASAATPSDGDSAEPVRYTVLSAKAIVGWAVLILLVGVGVAVWLLLAFSGGDVDANRTQLDAIRTAGTIVVGTGGAVALLLAARKQRSTEIGLRQKDRDQADVARAYALQERSTQATETDARERRITELYTKAVEQLGSDKAPVRLGGLYALERLAQDNEPQRQTIINVLCAYLRMPYIPPGEPPAAGAEDNVVLAHRERTQEREVRLTAQRLLHEHLRPGNPENPVPTFWPDITLDLTDALLINFTLADCALNTATFESVTFIGTANFESATFTGNADFASATFGDSARFNTATFTSASFQSATFVATAHFQSATFTDNVYFGLASFDRLAFFESVTFTRNVYFRDVTFASAAFFKSASFTGDADFSAVNFIGGRGHPATGDIVADFSLATFTHAVPAEVARFLPPAPGDDLAAPHVGRRRRRTVLPAAVDDHDERLAE